MAKQIRQSPMISH